MVGIIRKPESKNGIVMSEKFEMLKNNISTALASIEKMNLFLFQIMNLKMFPVKQILS